MKKLFLAETHPIIASQWHPTKNGDCTPSHVTSGSDKKFWWKCLRGEDHEWMSTVGARTSGTGCPCCINQKAVLSNCLATTHPDIAAQWHSTKNGKLTPRDVTAGSNIKVWWSCLKGDDHEWDAMVSNRTKKKSGCPCCTNQKVVPSNCLATTHPELAREWHPTKNKGIMPQDVAVGSGKGFWWKCLKGKDHEWITAIAHRAGGTGCPYCVKKKVILSNCLAATHPDIASQWHSTKNGKLTPRDLTAGSNIKVWWSCLKGDDHEWEAPVKDRLAGKGCPCCRGLKVVLSNCLATTHPELANEWHSIKNPDFAPQKVTAGSDKKVWWQCSKGADHEWEAAVSSRVSGSGCPGCNSGWTLDIIRLFVRSLLPLLDALDEAELYVIMQQNGLLDISHRTKGHFFVHGLKSGKFPKEELEKFANGQSPLVEEAILNQGELVDSQNDDLEAPENVVSELLIKNAGELFIAETKDVLAAIDSPLFANLDAEVADFFIKSAIAKIWRHAFEAEDVAIQQLDQFKEGLYSQEVKNLFLQDYHGAKALTVPEGYSFDEDPNLMQMYTAYLVKARKRIGNWSGTGAGKTRSAVLASRVIDAKITVICCPNNVISNWELNITKISPDGVVYKKELAGEIDHSKPQYFILNYEFFQQPQAESELNNFLKKHTVDFVIVDEIHFSKQREIKTVSQRKRVIAAFLSQVTANNSDIHVLGMSATPVLNNLFEGKTLIELVTGIHHDDLQTKATVSNCISMYQKFIAHGIRWLRQEKCDLNIQKPEIDCSEFLAEIRQSVPTGSVIGLEAILTRAKIPCILANIRPKTLVYSHYRQGIETTLKEAIEQQGWKAALFTGDTKEGLDAFINGDADVLIATSCIATGVDGLQRVCNRLIINSLPWTHAEYKQLVGRIYRQGQINQRVDVIIPITFADINGKRWSYCESRWNRIEFKRSIADAAVDGVIPEGHLRSEAQAYKDVIAWLERLDRGDVYEIERQKINMTLSDAPAQGAIRRVGDLSLMNQKINRETSSQTHYRFMSNPDEWHDYHEAYRETRKDWEVVPFEEAIKWCKLRPQAVVADFGCGEALLAKGLQNKVYSFDHVAINEGVTACDMVQVPLGDASIDLAIFSLSLMGKNWIDYLKEAKRCLKLDGHLWIAEPTGRIQDIERFKELINRLGFDFRSVNEKGKFTFIVHHKADREINEIMVRGLLEKEILG